VLWWRRGRIEWKRDIAPLAPWLLCGAAAGLFTAWVERTFVGADGPDFALSAMQRVLLAGHVVWFYFWKLAWPVDLNFFYPRWAVDASAWTQWSYPVALAAAAAVLWRMARRNRGPLAGLLYFGGTLFPVLGFFNVYPFLYSWVADHFDYLARLGVFVPVSYVLAKAASRIPEERRWRSWVVAGALLLLLGTLSQRQTRMYADADTHYAEILARNPQCWLAHNNLGSDLLDTPGRLEEAVGHIRESLRLKPDNALAHNNMGRALMRVPGRAADAEEEYRIAIRIKPDLVQAHDNLGQALSALGRIPEAITEHQVALQLSPNYAQAHNDLGSEYAKSGRTEDAIREFETALSLNPESAEAHGNRGLALARLGRLPEAVTEFETALRLAPNSAQAHGNMGGALLRMRQAPEAIREFQSALQIDPQSAQAHYNLAFAFSKMPDRTSDAVSEYQAALRIDPDFMAAHANLAVLLDEMGKRAEALAEFQAADRLKGHGRGR
jgi:tetratricopeptide (TPR) repeat protein